MFGRCNTSTWDTGAFLLPLHGLSEIRKLTANIVAGLARTICQILRYHERRRHSRNLADNESDRLGIRLGTPPPAANNTNIMISAIYTMLKEEA
jgi:hypothetical protein